VVLSFLLLALEAFNVLIGLLVLPFRLLSVDLEELQVLLLINHDCLDGLLLLLDAA
jgi:hypothetical protein